MTVFDGSNMVSVETESIDRQVSISTMEIVRNVCEIGAVINAETVLYLTQGQVSTDNGYRMNKRHSLRTRRVSFVV